MEESCAENINMKMSTNTTASTSHYPHVFTHCFPSHFMSGTEIEAQTSDMQYCSQDQLVASLYREIEIRDSKIKEAEDKYNKTCSNMPKLLESLLQQVDSQNERIFELERKYNEKEAICSSTARLLISLTQEIDHKNEEINSKNEEIAELQHCCNKMHFDVQRLKRDRHNISTYILLDSRKMQSTHVENKRLKMKIQTLEKELEQLTQLMDRGQLDQEQKFSQNLEGSLQSQLRTLKTELAEKTDDVQRLQTELVDKTGDVEYLQNLNETLIVREHRINNELVDARRELLNSLHTVLSSRTMIGIKRMGELNSKPFRDACASKFTGEESDLKCAEVCSLWEENLKNPIWHPFKHSIIEGSVQEIVDGSDTRLEELRKEWGEEVYKAVTSALLELNEYNPSGRYPVPEIWNYREERKVSLKEVIGYLIQQLKTRKRKRS